MTFWGQIPLGLRRVFLGTMLGPMILSEIHWPNSASSLILKRPPSLLDFVPGILKCSMVFCIPSTHQTLIKDQLRVDDEELTRSFPNLDKGSSHDALCLASSRTSGSQWQGAGGEG